MTAFVMEGSTLARSIREHVKKDVESLRQSRVAPQLATILVGDDPASRSYFESKQSACEDVGIGSRNLEFKANTSQSELFQAISRLNNEDAVTGIILQLPLPEGLNELSAIMSISPEKDVDGLHPTNLGQLWRKSARLVPCTPRGVVVLLKHYGVQISGSHAVIINRTNLVGRPLAQLLLNEDSTVTICHSKTTNLKEITRQADILVTGIGHRQQFTVGADMVKQGAVVVDVGTSILNGKLSGDVDFESVLHVASSVTPVPGGVGPMTVALLLYNTLLATSIQKGAKLSFDLEELRRP